MRILLISPNTLTVPYPVYPLGLDYVAGSVASEHEVKIVDLNVLSRLELQGQYPHSNQVASVNPLVALSYHGFDSEQPGPLGGPVAG